MSRQLARFYQELLDSSFVTYSSLNSSSKAEADRLQMLGAVIKRPRGRGFRIEVENELLIQSESSRIFPSGLEAALTPIETRHQSVIALKDAKANNVHYPTVDFRILDPERVTCLGSKIIQDGVNWSVVFSVSILESSLSDLHISGDLVLIENQEVFLFANPSFPDASALMWYSGRLKKERLEWIQNNVESVLHCPDFDPVGLQEYLLYKEVLGDKLQMHIPDGLDDSFKFAKPSLFDDNKKFMPSILESPFHDEDSLRILYLIQKHHAGLEQESAFSPSENQ